MERWWKKRLKESYFFLNGPALYTPPPLNDPGIKRRVFFAAFHIQCIYRGFHEKGTHNYLCAFGIDRQSPLNKCTLQVPFIWNQLYINYFNLLWKLCKWPRWEAADWTAGKPTSSTTFWFNTSNSLGTRDNFRNELRKNNDNYEEQDFRFWKTYTISRISRFWKLTISRRF